MNKYLENKLTIQVLLFKLNNVFYGIPIDLSIKEISMFSNDSFKPTIEFKDNFIGSIILREQLIPLLDLNKRYSLSENLALQKSCVIVKKYSSNNDNLIALLVEGKLDIKEIELNKFVKKENVFKEFYGYVKFLLDEKEEFLILLDTNVYFEKEE